MRSSAAVSLWMSGSRWGQTGLNLQAEREREWENWEKCWLNAKVFRWHFLFSCCCPAKKVSKLGKLAYFYAPAFVSRYKQINLLALCNLYPQSSQRDKILTFTRLAAWLSFGVIITFWFEPKVCALIYLPILPLSPRPARCQSLFPAGKLVFDLPFSIYLLCPLCRAPVILAWSTPVRSIPIFVAFLGTPTRPCHANANINSSSACHLPLCSFMTGTGSAWACSDSCLELASHCRVLFVFNLPCDSHQTKQLVSCLSLCASQWLGNTLNANAICTNEPKILIALGAWRTKIKQLCGPTYQCPI